MSNKFKAWLWVPPVILVAIGAWWFFSSSGDREIFSSDGKTMILRSPAFAADGVFPMSYTCDGQDSSPPLKVAGLPPGSKSLAIVMTDFDSEPNGLVHWSVWNLPAVDGPVPGGLMPPGTTEGQNDFAVQGWSGPCPPAGPYHRYVFKAYALSQLLSLPNGAKFADFERAVKPLVLDSASLVAVYSRQYKPQLPNILK